MIKGKLNAIDSVYKKHILSFSRPACRRILTWWNLKGLVELVNLQSTAMKYYFGVQTVLLHKSIISPEMKINICSKKLLFMSSCH